MSDRTVLLNGAFVADHEATVPIMDRGLLFADAVYEGLGVLDGQIVDYVKHAARLRRSLEKLEMRVPADDVDLWTSLMELIERNGLDEGFIYLQVTRGTAERDYVFDRSLQPTVFAFTQPTFRARASEPPMPLRLWSSPDLRWARRDIKTTNLLGQVLAKQAAHDNGADEGLLIAPDGTVTECASRSFFVVDQGRIVVRPLAEDILPGVTRSSMLDVAAGLGVPVDERVMTLDEVIVADEALATGASTYVEPVVEIDHRAVGDGRPGAVTLRLREHYIEYARSSFWSPPAN